MGKNFKYRRSHSNLPIILLIVVVLAAIFLVASLFKPSGGEGDETSDAADTTTVADTTAADTTSAAETSAPADTTAEDTTGAPETTDPPVVDPPVTTDPPPIEPPVTTGGEDIDTSAPSVTDIYPGKPASYANQLPASPAVGNDYFSDALFIGDSRTVGFQNSTGIAATFYAKVSFNIGQLNKQDDSSRFINVSTSAGVVKCNVYEALEYNAAFGKVYLRMGLSELGWDTNSFFRTYKNFIEHIKTKLPNAKIYIESVIPVSAARSNQNLFGVTNQAVWEYNGRLSQLADECGVYFVNVAEYFTLEDGTLPPGYAPDGVHMEGRYYLRWLDYLATHTAS